MEPFDKRLKERAKQEPFPLPETYAGKVRNTCAALKETTMKDTKQKRSCRALLGVAAALAVFVAIPNVSPSAAAAMSDIPVLGAVVRVVTFRDYQYDDGHNTADVHVPELGGSDAADEVNDQVQAFTDQLIAQFQADCEATGEGYQGLDVTSSVVTDSDTWFTLRIDATKTQASGYNFTDSITSTRPRVKPSPSAICSGPTRTTSPSCPRRSCGRWRSRWPQTRP